jgi:hypothetical protein
VRAIDDATGIEVGYCYLDLFYVEADDGHGHRVGPFVDLSFLEVLPSHRRTPEVLQVLFCLALDLADEILTLYGSGALQVSPERELARVVEQSHEFVRVPGAPYDWIAHHSSFGSLRRRFCKRRNRFEPSRRRNAKPR